MFFLIIFLLITMQVFSQPIDPSQDMTPLFDDPPFWRQAMGGAVVGSPVSQAESVVMVSDGGNVKAFSWQGKPLWDYYARGRLQPFITRSREGTTYVCRSANQNSGVLIAINRSGRELWQINLGEPLNAPIITGWDGRLFVFTVNRILCYTASGFPLWSKKMEKGTAIKPQSDGQGGFFLVLEDGEFLIINAFGNVISEKLATIPMSIIPVKISGDAVSFLFVYSTGALELYDTDGKNLDALGEITLQARPLAVTTWNSNAAFLLANCRVCLLSLTEKKVLWNSDSHLSATDLAVAGFDTNFFYDERGIYLLTRSGASAFLEDGRRLWLMRLRGAASLPAFSDEGVLYSGGADWILYAYKLEERVKIQKRLLYGPAPEGNYGTGISQPGAWSNYPNRFTESEMDIWFREIETALRQGQVGEKEKEYVSWLMEISGSSMGIYNRESRAPVFTPPRARAARLLAYMGSTETIPFLANLFTRERDTAVKAAAAEALGKIGVDPEGLAMGVFSEAVFPPSPLRDEQVLTAVVIATGALCRFSGPPLSETGIRILTLLSSPDRPPAVRSRAEREILTLRY